METQSDLLTDAKFLPANNAPFAIGISSFGAVVVSIFVAYTFLWGLAIVIFLGAFVTSIIGVLVAKKYKIKYPELTPEQQRKLQWGKVLSVLTLVVCSLAIIAFGAFLVSIDIDGFGR
jgi:uncharacterized membrane protein